MKLRQTLQQKPTVTPQLVLANRLLQFSSVELEQAVAQEVAENPALQLVDVQRCPRCGLALSDGYCPSCEQQHLRREEDWSARQEYDPDNASYSAYSAGSEGYDPISRLASNITLSDHLLRQLRINLPPDDMPIAACLVDSLDDRGFLRCDLDDVASVLDVTRARVERIVSTVQQLEPVGIAARDARESLLIQLRHLGREGIERPRLVGDEVPGLAEALIRDHWDALGRRALSNVAEAAGVSVSDVRAALRFIRDNLNPFPAHAHWASLHDSPPERTATCPRPDVIITEAPGASAQEYEIELPRARAFRLRVRASYLGATGEAGGLGSPSDDEGWEQWEKFRGRARLFVKSIEQRWQTLHQLARCLIECQRDFLAHGDKHLKPLTRSEVADIMDVHESTVSRAVADKYAQLPSGRLVPLAKFFDDSAAIKEIIKELVAQEDAPLTDREIAETLSQRGYSVARRTVTKYRNALNILPSPLRRRSKELAESQD